MLLVNVAMLNLSQRDLIQSKADTGRMLINALSLNIGHLNESAGMPLSAVFQERETEKEIKDLLSKGGYSELVLLDNSGNTSFSTSSDEDNKIMVNLARISMQAQDISVNYMGSGWGVFWLSKKDINISGPLIYRGRLLGGISIRGSLDPIYKSLRESEGVVLFYVILDTIILAFVGVYLLSRIVVNPIRRLVGMTDTYRDEDVLKTVFEDSGNEIGQLSRSLSIMLQRLDQNKKELHMHISSLEKANMELKQAQNEIIRAEKLASVGRLAAGIAHEIGNPLGIILGYLELIRKGDIADEEKRDFLNRVESEITRINVIIRQLLDFSRPSTGNKEENHIHDIISDTINMLSPHPLMEGIEVQLDFKAETDMVFSDVGQLQQVFLNIIMNAADVLKDRVHTDNECPRIVIATQNKDDAIVIRFSDNGPGIQEGMIQHIFDPFYTTKEPGKGTGLGLSVSYMIIEAQGGTIRAESPEGRGTSIIIDLPIR